MPRYDYKCPSCGTVEEVIHSIKQDPEIVCPVCAPEGNAVVMQRLISGGGGFILGSTETMGWKENRLRVKKNAELGLKQMERYGSTGTSLVPNVGGETVATWSEAQKLARDKGKNADSYNAKVEVEKFTSKTSGVNDLRWKAAKETRRSV
jgi:putative FmdB family regulatory protein